MKHKLVLLSDKINWAKIESGLVGYYPTRGQPSMPIRPMAGCLFLKRLYNLGDETLASAWAMNPYMQYFCGGAHFQHRFPCDPSDLVHFRNRIGQEGIKSLFIHSVGLHGKQAGSKMVLSDTTVQENNTTFPTDAKLAKQVIDICNRIDLKQGVDQRQSYKRVSKQALRDSHNAKHPMRRKKPKKATKKPRTIAGRLIRELRRKLSSEKLAYELSLLLYERDITQQRSNKNKVYSLHKPFTTCIAKVKAHKAYGFGNKVGLIPNPMSRVITAISAFKGNPHDSKTIAPLLDQMEGSLGYLSEEPVYDRGGKGAKDIKGVTISTPRKPLKRDTPYQNRKKRKKFRTRAMIGPVIGHLKLGFRMAQNYLHGQHSPQVNAILAATGWNLKKMMGKLKQKTL